MSRRSDKRSAREFKAIASDQELCQALRRLYHRLQDVEDLRSSVNREYELPDIFMLLILGLLIGKNGIHLLDGKMKVPPAWTTLYVYL